MPTNRTWQVRRGSLELIETTLAEPSRAVASRPPSDPHRALAQDRALDQANIKEWLLAPEARRELVPAAPEFPRRPPPEFD